MRLSEILKSDSTTISAPLSPRPAAPPAPPPPPPAGKGPVPLQDLAAVIERTVAEARQQLEKDFQTRLEKIQEEARQTREEQLREEEKKSLARTEALKKEKQQVLEQLEEMRRENESLKTTTQSLESAKREISETHAKLAEEFQKKIAELEIERQRQHQKPPPVSTPVPPPPPPPPKPQPILAPSLIPWVAAEPPPKVVFNPATLVKARDLYQHLLAGALTFFERARQNDRQPGLLAKTMARFIEETDLHEDLIGVIAEPYPVEQAFIYHAVNCCVMALILGNDLKLSFEELRDLGMAALTHDLGLLDVQEGLNYPQQLPDSMRHEILKHPENGAKLLTGHVSETVLTAIEQHQELMNGKGYPKGLKEDEIHLFARIISIVDSFEAMVHERPYRQKPMEINQAVKEMIETERGLYDRDVMKALLARVGLYPIKSLVELSNKQVARVLRQNRQFPLSPIVQIEFDENGTKVSAPSVIDLSKNQLMHIIGSVTSKPSYTQERIVEKKHKLVKKRRRFNVLWEMLPLVFMAGILVLLVYLIVKI